MISAFRRNLYPSARPLQRHALAQRCSSGRRHPAGPVLNQLPSEARGFADVRDNHLDREVLFSGSRVICDLPVNEDKKSPDERTLKLGKTVATLHDRLPTLLASPLPQDILSPQISLHLFPSTHPHLPTVTGRIAYLAALWTAPVAWGRVPVIGNVKLVIESERMIKNGTHSPLRSEKLVVRWKTCGKTGRGMGGFYKGFGGSGEQVDKITEFLKNDEEFCGLFIFEFDEAGRIVSHTIEHAQEGGNWEKMTRVVSVTDWLIGLAKGKNGGENPGYALGYCDVGQRQGQQRHDRMQRR